MVPSFTARLRRRQRLETAEDLTRFLHAEAMRVAQTSLTTYLKGRMGTAWPRHFADPAFADQIAQAQKRSFPICLADLTVFALGRIPVADRDKADIAAWLFQQASDGDGADVLANRLTADWTHPETAFAPSQSKLIELAPVSPAFQQADREAFANALALRWAAVCDRFRQRADLARLADALALRIR